MVEHEFFMSLTQDRIPIRTVMSSLDGRSVRHSITEDEWQAMSQENRVMWLGATYKHNEKALEEL